MKNQNESEKLFEQYLNLNEFSDRWTHEPEMHGRNKKPDYLLNHNNCVYFFEVKELRGSHDEPSKAGGFDPYASLRSEINEAREKFKEYKDYCCSLIVFNIGDWKAILDPEFVLGAMLGNLGIAIDIDIAEGSAVDGTERDVFLDGGKMIDRKGRLQNTTISAIVVLEKLLNNMEIEKAFREEERKLGRKFTTVEAVQCRIELQKKYSIGREVPRVIVVENPFARITFPENLFVGPFDEHWRWIEENGKIERVSVGGKLRELEEFKGKS